MPDLSVFGFALVGNETPEEAAALTSMLEACARFVGEIMAGAPPRWLTLCGKSGTGKTHMARAISKFLSDKLQGIYNTHTRSALDPAGANVETTFSYAQSGARFMKWPDMVDQMRDGDYGTYRNACRDFFKILDEIGGESKEKDREGKAKPTEFAVGKLTRLVDERLGRWSVFTSNYGRGELATVYDVRIASRLTRDGNVLIELPQSVRDFGLRREALTKAGGKA